MYVCVQSLRVLSNNCNAVASSKTSYASPCCLQNLEVEQQLRTQEQLQQLAAVAVTASAQQAQQALAEEAVAAADGRAPFKLPVPPLGAATGLSPPNSQRKLLAHLSLSMRPADREVG